MITIRTKFKLPDDLLKEAQKRANLTGKPQFIVYPKDVDSPTIVEVEPATGLAADVTPEYDTEKATAIVEAMRKLKPDWTIEVEHQDAISVNTKTEAQGDLSIWFGNANETFGASVMWADGGDASYLETEMPPDTTSVEDLASGAVLAVFTYISKLEQHRADFDKPEPAEPAEPEWSIESHDERKPKTEVKYALTTALHFLTKFHGATGDTGPMDALRDRIIRSLAYTAPPYCVAYGAIYAGTPEQAEAGTAPRIALMDRDDERTLPTERDANAVFLTFAANCTNFPNAVARECWEVLSNPDMISKGSKPVVELLEDALDIGRSQSWEGFSLRREVNRYEANTIKDALRDAGGSVTKAAYLLGFSHHQSLVHLLKGRHKSLTYARTKARPRRKSLLKKA